MPHFLSAHEAIARIPDNATIAITGGGGGLCEAALLFKTVEERFLATNHPQNITLMHALGVGDRQGKGIGHFAHKGLTKAVIGGHWVWSPKMQEMAKNNEIEAYILPAGVMMQLYREIAAKRVGLFSHIGLGTFIDPRFEGGRMNVAAKRQLSELHIIDGQEVLRYKTFPINIALLRGSKADEKGNISLDGEAANLDIQALALAAKNSGGKVIVEVKEIVQSLPPRSVRIPSAWVDSIVINPNQMLAHTIQEDKTITGEQRGSAPPHSSPPTGERGIIAARAFKELKKGQVVNYGFGIPDQVARLATASGLANALFTTIEHGIYGGDLLEGSLFGFSRNAESMIDAPTQFDFYSGGGLDIAFLGFGEIDAQGNVNVSKLGGITVGPGGFMDIAQNAKSVVFCGTLTAKGDIQKLVKRVEQITFSGQEAFKRGQSVLYITERAVFKLVEGGVALMEVAKGYDKEKDVLSKMGFVPK
jgi:propionate CoA-transferase